MTLAYFKKNLKDNNDKESIRRLYKYFILLRESKILFLIVHYPRYYGRDSHKNIWWK